MFLYCLVCCFNPFGLLASQKFDLLFSSVWFSTQSTVLTCLVYQLVRSCFTVHSCLVYQLINRQVCCSHLFGFRPSPQFGLLFSSVWFSTQSTVWSAVLTCLVYYLVHSLVCCSHLFGLPASQKFGLLFSSFWFTSQSEVWSAVLIFWFSTQSSVGLLFSPVWFTTQSTVWFAVLICLVFYLVHSLVCSSHLFSSPLRQKFGIQINCLLSRIF